ncbi:MAG TPA: NADPH-dependent glutamate synthase [Firmicutes bacterium]|nr:NADPH-dependent glutamate synthase [Candidatus Fermentithermobacillaceae bacterium]
MEIMAVKKRVEMPTQDPMIRRTNFDEVALGYTEEMAREEASRCLNCKKPLCVEGCPVSVDIPRFIELIKEGKFQDSIDVVKSTNSLPAICGRVCPQENQCEAKCVLGRRGDPIAIGRLERFVADWEMAHGKSEIPNVSKTGKKVAIVGAGPAGLTCGGDLAKLGYDVTIFESLHEPGGVLMYGIPEFRLPKSIVKTEVDYVKKLGVNIELDFIVGRTLTIDEIFAQGFEAVFVGSGAGLPMFMHIPGENLNGVYSANEYLTRINLMKAYLFPEYDTPIVSGKKVVVVGAGNVAMDSVRCALRLGAEKAMIVYRRGREEMPARAEEIHHAEEEGVEFHLLANPVRIFGNDKGWVTSIECIRMELGEPDESGRRRPVPIPGSEFVMEADTVVMALGTSPNPIIVNTTDGLSAHSWGGLIVDEETGRTKRPRVWAGGDAVTGSATVILAMGAGKTAAKDIHEYLSSGSEDW